MYKDKDKQREANRAIQAKRRSKGVTQGVTELGCDRKGMTHNDATYNYSRNPVVLVKPERTAQGNIRVSKPGDDDYEPQCETTRAFIEDRPKRPETGKRGKDIKCFTDLPPDVQETIRKMSMLDGKLDETIKANRTATAVNYQHLFPDRYYSTSAGGDACGCEVTASSPVRRLQQHLHARMERRVERGR